MAGSKDIAAQKAGGQQLPVDPCSYEIYLDLSVEGVAVVIEY